MPPFRSVLLILVLSVLLVIPCFWHPQVEAGDLASHVYTAWLAQLVHQGLAPGVYLMRQWDNVLFDVLLYQLIQLLGFALGQKFATAICVLVFFWGVFALMQAAAGRTPWFLTPLIAMLAYGYVFHLGFMNYYLSLGLACLALSLLWPARRNGLLAAAIVMPVIYFAHPLGFLLFLGATAYRLLWLYAPGKTKLLLSASALAVCFLARWYVARHGYELEWRQVPLWQLTGAEQFFVFTPRYLLFTYIAEAIFLLATIASLFNAAWRSSFRESNLLLLELLLISFAVTALLPENLHLDPTGGWVGALGTRLTLVTAIFALCWLAALPPRVWQLLSTGVLALLFFSFIYQDTAFLNRIESSAEAATRQLPFGTRILASVFTPADYRTTYVHIVDRACIGHCFLYSNYEPSTRQFRIRVQPGSPVVTASVDDCEDMQSGTYDVQEEDLPLKQLYQCDFRDLTRICVRDLAAGEQNGRLGFHPALHPLYSEFR